MPSKIEKHYAQIMDILEAESPIRYYRCGKCNGPVVYGYCCKWCGSTDPIPVTETDAK